MKKSLPLIILTVVLVAGIAVYLALGNNSPVEKEETEPSTELYNVSAVDPNALIGIFYENNNGAYTFTLKSDGSGWLWSENTALPLSTDPFVAMVSCFTDLTSSTRLTDVSAEEYARYGLATPTLTVRFLLLNDSLEYKIGILNSYNGLYYISESSDTSTVYMVSGEILSCFDITPDKMIADDTIPTPKLKNISSVVFKKNGKEYVYTYYPEEDATLENEDAIWMLSIDGEEEFFPGDEISRGLSLALEQIKLDERVSFDKAEHQALGIDGSCTLTVNYLEEKTTSTENGDSVNVSIEKSYTLIIGNGAENGLFYAALDGSILAYTLSPAILGNLGDYES